MPPVMPGYVGKGVIFGKLDQLLNDPTRRTQLLNRIRAKNAQGQWSEELLDVGAQMLPLTPGEKQHIQEHWFDEYGSWWPSEQPVDIIIRLGLIQAIGLATRTPQTLRFDCYWVCGVEHVELVSCLSPGQITILFFTPNAPVSDQLPEDFAHSTQREEIYTVRHRSRGPGEYQVQPDEEFCEFVQPLIPQR
ncbi:MAG TPA: hypothetical protein VEI82_12205 [Myxococcota bacterium]|nr:hypothetical protein [Myxococcota bacterium]